MKKCPRCHNDVLDHQRYCPNCGLDLSTTQTPKKSNRIITILLIVLLLGAPFIYSGVFNGIFENMTNTLVKNELGEFNNQNATIIMNQFDNLVDFNSTYTNVSEYVKGISEYEESLKIFDFEKDYNIIVLNNNNIIYQLTYTTTINEIYDLTIVREFDRIHSYNNQTITFKKNNQSVFSDLILNNQEIAIINEFVDVNDITQNIVSEFSLREEEFNKIKDTLGHYGMGTYYDQTSFVIERYDLVYTSVFKHKETASSYIC